MANEQLIQLGSQQITEGLHFSETPDSLNEEGVLPSAGLQSKLDTVGSQINLFSWGLFIISLITIFVESKPAIWGGRLFLLTFLMGGLSIFLTGRLKISSLDMEGAAARMIGGLLFAATLFGLVQTFLA